MVGSDIGLLISGDMYVAQAYYAEEYVISNVTLSWHLALTYIATGVYTFVFPVLIIVQFHH